MQRKRSLERRLFGWLAALAVLPALAVLAVSLAVAVRSLNWMGTLGPWDRVAESGRALIDAVEAVPRADSTLIARADRHRTELSESLLQAERWRFLGTRVASLIPFVAAALALVLIVVAMVLSRSLAREIARPIGELVDWAGRLGRGEPLPPPSADDANDPTEVAVLRASLRTAADELAAGRRRSLEMERTRAWGEMARRVAHEMKNPLTPMRLAVHRLEAGTSDPAMAEAVTVIREETERLERLAGSFAQLGRPSEGPAAEVDLAELLAGLLETDVPASVRTELEVEPGTSAVLGHYDALQRAFRNLIRNAVEAIAEANGAAGLVQVRVGPRPGGDGALVRIADNGVGIPGAQVDAIFEPDRTFKAKGTGLGLAIVRQVAAAHGGTVAARPREPRGAEFIVELPGVAGSDAQATRSPGT